MEYQLVMLPEQLFNTGFALPSLSYDKASIPPVYPSPTPDPSSVSGNQSPSHSAGRFTSETAHHLPNESTTANPSSSPLATAKAPIAHSALRKTWKHHYHIHSTIILLSLILIPLQIWHLCLENLSNSPSWGSFPAEFKIMWRKKRFDMFERVVWGFVFVGILANALHSLIYLSRYHFLLHQPYAQTSRTPPCVYHPRRNRGPPYIFFHTSYDIGILCFFVQMVFRSLTGLQEDRALCATGMSTPSLAAGLKHELRDEARFRGLKLPSKCETVIWELRTVTVLSVGIWCLLGVAHILLIVARIREWLASKNSDTNHPLSSPEEIELESLRGEQNSRSSISALPTPSPSGESSLAEPNRLVLLRSSSHISFLPPNVVPGREEFARGTWPATRKERENWKDILLLSQIP